MQNVDLSWLIQVTARSRSHRYCRYRAKQQHANAFFWGKNGQNKKKEESARRKKNISEKGKNSRPKE
jgi:hypothetical protein